MNDSIEPDANAGPGRARLCLSLSRLVRESERDANPSRPVVFGSIFRVPVTVRFLVPVTVRFSVGLCVFFVTDRDRAFFARAWQTFWRPTGLQNARVDLLKNRVFFGFLAKFGHFWPICG